MDRNIKLTAFLALASVSFFWGTTYLAIRIGVADAPPFLFSGIRNTIAGLILLAYFLLKDRKFPPFNDIIKASIPGFFMILLSNGLVTYAEQSVPSGLTALLCSFVPFLVVGINVGILRTEKFQWTIALGLILGFVGLVIIFYDNVLGITDPAYITGICMILGANISWTCGSLVYKSLKLTMAPLLSAGFQMAIAGFAQVLVSLVLDGPADFSVFTPNTWYSLGYLIVFGSIVGYGSYAYALANLPTTVATLYAYINPIVAVFLGWVILSEEIYFSTILATTITLGGVYLVNRGYQSNGNK